MLSERVDRSGAQARGPWLVWVLLAAVALAGLTTMLFAPIEQLLPPGVEIPRAVLLVQPAVLLVALAALGWWTAPKVGLDAPVFRALAERGDWANPLRRAALPALAGGVICGLCIAAFGAIAGDVLQGRAQAFEMPLVTRMAYGGTVEELIFRWGLLSLFALGLTRLRVAPGAALWIANGAAALLFAAGHVPGVMLAASDPPGWLPAAVLLANAVIGLVCGWLFMRRGIEAAMIAHALAHLVSVPLLALVA
ncbi:MAG TPA: CPBP family glutamic-type intramembrane protease [Croceibacterium sp.]